jgi:uncharacterized protein YcbX
VVGTVAQLWRYPVKSMQGAQADVLELTADGVVGDRRWGLLEADTGHVLSAKRAGALLTAVGGDDTATLPDGTVVTLTEPGAGARIGAWLGRDVVVRSAEELGPDHQPAIDMTFDPPNDEAEYYEIPIRKGSLLDLGAIHLLTTGTLAACAAARPELDWTVRRFRPNLVIDHDGGLFAEQEWVGQDLRIGDVRLHLDQPTMRCAMALRAQPGIDREPGIFQALNELNTLSPNHLGMYASVVEGGSLTVGAPVELVG